MSDLNLIQVDQDNYFTTRKAALMGLLEADERLNLELDDYDSYITVKDQIIEVVFHQSRQEQLKQWNLPDGVILERYLEVGELNLLEKLTKATLKSSYDLVTQNPIDIVPNISNTLETLGISLCCRQSKPAPYLNIEDNYDIL
ncbi:MAG: hypothetical protein F6K53_20400 [Moorea sp. SIO4A1]|uniref:hypothetical protein n=1 Tax=Moorena sp. SIO4A1 TaxID=2607835 RepID=UPI00144C52CC|nr:hypothetical protein [Moorena sp. SIO4A1]NEQ59634.1 hypothetical protein [Moorena sp. SIO4A1]